jgi:hypothetical protein
MLKVVSVLTRYQFFPKVLLMKTKIFDNFWWGGGTFVSVGWQAYNSFSTMYLVFLSQPFLRFHPPIYSTCSNARLHFFTIFVPSFDPNEWCLKNGLYSGGLNPGPLGHESSGLTTRPQPFFHKLTSNNLKSLCNSKWIFFQKNQNNNF